MGQQGFDWHEPVADRLVQWPPSLEALSSGWREPVEHFLISQAGQTLSHRVQQDLAAGAVVYPPHPFRALELTALDEVRVVIVGQDPYHGPGQAEGLAFSVAPGVKLPPSLRNIFKELQRSLAVQLPQEGSLMRWARQGVLLLNTSLTVRDGEPASHARWGWEGLTDELMVRVAARMQPTVFMLWGAHAQAKRDLIEQADRDGRHLLLMANHPSPLSALRPPVPFLGCGHFAMANAFLSASGGRAISW